jgi:hypothetical protein
MSNEDTVLSTRGTLRSEDLVSTWNALEDDDSRWRSDRYDASMLLLQAFKAQEQSRLEQALLKEQEHLLSDIANFSYIMDDVSTRYPIAVARADLEDSPFDLSRHLVDMYAEGSRFIITTRMHNQMRYIVHLSKLGTPCRKLRKCHMRKIYRRRALARRRYGL